MAFPREFPIFPLPQVILVPGALLPLHIFEPRYRDMVADAMIGERYIAMAFPLPPANPNEIGRPNVLPVCGLGRIVQHAPFPDGRSNIVLEGVARMEIEREITTDKRYRLVVGHPLEDDHEPDMALDRRARALLARVEGTLGEPLEEARGLPADRLADLFLLRLALPMRTKYDVFSVTDLGARLDELERLVTRMERRRYPDDFERGDPRLN